MALLTAVEEDLLREALAVSQQDIPTPAEPTPRSTADEAPAQRAAAIDALSPSPSPRSKPSSAVPRRRSARPFTSPSVEHAILGPHCVDLLQKTQRLEEQLTQCLTPGTAEPRNSPDALASVAAQLCRLYNMAAMKLLELHRKEQCFHLLQKAQVLCENEDLFQQTPRDQSTLLAITLNNLGVYHQRSNASQRAIAALERAAHIEAELLQTQQASPGDSNETRAESRDQTGTQIQTEGHVTEDTATPGSTQINLCAAYSAAGRHEEALQCTARAMQQLAAGYGFDARLMMRWARGKDGAVQRRRPASSIARPLPGKSKSAGQDASDSPAQPTHAAPQQDSYPQEGEQDESLLYDGTPRGKKGGPIVQLHDAAAAFEFECVAGPEAAGPDQPPCPTVQRLVAMPGGAARVLSTCLYSNAAQLEHLGRVDEALPYYQAAAGLATKLLGRTSDLSKLFHRSLQAFRSTVSRGAAHAPHHAHSHGPEQAQQQQGGQDGQGATGSPRRVRAASAPVRRPPAQHSSSHRACAVGMAGASEAKDGHIEEARKEGAQGRRSRGGAAAGVTSPRSAYAAPPVMLPEGGAPRIASAKHPRSCGPPVLTRRPATAHLVPTLTSYGKVPERLLKLLQSQQEWHTAQDGGEGPTQPIVAAVVERKQSPQYTPKMGVPRHTGNGHNQQHVANVAVVGKGGQGQDSQRAGRVRPSTARAALQTTPQPPQLPGSRFPDHGAARPAKPAALAARKALSAAAAALAQAAVHGPQAGTASVGEQAAAGAQTQQAGFDTQAAVAQVPALDTLASGAIATKAQQSARTNDAKQPAQQEAVMVKAALMPKKNGLVF